MQLKKILIAHSWTDVTLNIQTKKLAYQLSQQCEVIFLTQARIGHPMLKVNDNLTVYQWPNKRPTTREDFLFLYRLLKKEKPDAVIAHFGATNITMPTAWLAGVRHRIAWMHTLTDQYYLDNKSRLKATLQLSKRKFVYKFSSAAVVQNEFGRSDAINNYKIPGKKVFKIYNGITDPARINTADERIKSIRFVGRLDNSKGVDVLIKAFLAIAKQFDNVKLELVGKGAEQDNLKRLADEVGLTDRIIFHGVYTDYYKVFDFMEKAWFVVVPSRLDNFPTVVLEGLATSTPVIGARAGGIPEMIVENETGLLFEKGNVDELANKMKRLLTDVELRNKMSLKSRQRFEENFTIEKHADNVIDFLNTLS